MIYKYPQSEIIVKYSQKDIKFAPLGVILENEIPISFHRGKDYAYGIIFSIPSQK